MARSSSSSTSSRPSAWVSGSMLSVGVLVVTALLLMINYLAQRHYQRFDWTGGKLYTLSEKSKRVVAELDRDIDIVTVLRPGTEIATTIDALLDDYVGANPARVERRDLDAARDQLELQQLIDRYGIEQDQVIIIATDDDQRVINEFELVEYDYSGAQMGQAPQIAEFKGEQEITSAILSLIEAEKPKILLTTGHGEASFDGLDGRSLAAARQLLGKDNVELDTWDGLAQSGVPADTDLLVIAGPTTGFLEPELAALSTYVDGGGRVLALLDPAFDNSSNLVDLGLGGWLRGYGVEVGEDVVLDPSSEVAFFGPETLLAANFGNHPIVEGLQGSRVLLPLARSVRASDQPVAGWQIDELVMTSADGWGETELTGDGEVGFDANDVVGPVSIAVAASTESDAPGTASRLVVFGDLDFATDAQLATASNSLLLLNTLNWLIEREQLIDIEGRKTAGSNLTLSSSELNSIALIVLLMLPGAAILTGIWVALQRRR